MPVQSKPRKRSKPSYGHSAAVESGYEDEYYDDDEDFELEEELAKLEEELDYNCEPAKLETNKADHQPTTVTGWRRRWWRDGRQRCRTVSAGRIGKMIPSKQ